MLFLIVVLVTVVVVFIIRQYMYNNDDAEKKRVYYERLSNELYNSSLSLGESGVVLDMDRVDGNIQVLKECGINPQHLRLSTKSIPCLELIVYVTNKLGTTRLMVFTANMLQYLIDGLPSSSRVWDFLFGVPQTCQRVERLLNDMKDDGKLDLCVKSVQFLVDTPERLLGYCEIAEQFNVRLRVNIEIDIGLHRGGATIEMARQMMQYIHTHDESLKYAGFMGYDGHAPFHPLGTHFYSGELRNCVKQYHRFVELLSDDELNDVHYFNGGGSASTLQYGSWLIDAPHSSSSSGSCVPMNDFAIGSAILKPTAFDLNVGSLSKLNPSLFVAAPIIKVMRTRSPVPFLIGSFVWELYRLVYSRFTIALYVSGIAPCVSSVYPTLHSNPLMSSSSVNQLPTQALFHTSRNTDVRIGQFCIFRPAHNDAMCSYKCVQLMRSHTMVGTWVVYRGGI